MASARCVALIIGAGALFGACLGYSISLTAPEKQLAKHLMTTYANIGVIGRPVRKNDDCVKVTVSLMLRGINEVTRNSITMNIWPSLKWNDPFLSFDPTKFGNVRSVSLPAPSVWKPEFLNWMDEKHNKADQIGEMNAANVNVYEDGTVHWIPRVNIQTTCHDKEQTGKLNCSLIFGSWSQNSKILDYHFEDEKADFDMSYFRQTPGVEVIEHSASKRYDVYACCPERYAVLTYNLVIRKWPDQESCGAGR